MKDEASKKMEIRIARAARHSTTRAPCCYKLLQLGVFRLDFLLGFLQLPVTCNSPLLLVSLDVELTSFPGPEIRSRACT